MIGYNETVPFTRRIPSLPPKQLARDSKIAKQLITAWEISPEATKELFFRKAKFLSNPRYWETLRTIWVGCGRTDNVKEFMPYFKSSRPCKGWFMTVEDSEALDKMEFPLTIYRAYSNEEDPGISWATDLSWCKNYAKGRNLKIKTRKVERKDIFAYITRRGESEIIIL